MICRNTIIVQGTITSQIHLHRIVDLCVENAQHVVYVKNCVAVHRCLFHFGITVVEFEAVFAEAGVIQAGNAAVPKSVCDDEMINILLLFNTTTASCEKRDRGCSLVLLLFEAAPQRAWSLCVEYTRTSILAAKCVMYTQIDNSIELAIQAMCYQDNPVVHKCTTKEALERARFFVIWLL